MHDVHAYKHTNMHQLTYNFFHFFSATNECGSQLPQFIGFVCVCGMDAFSVPLLVSCLFTPSRAPDYYPAEQFTCSSVSQLCLTTLHHKYAYINHRASILVGVVTTPVQLCLSTAQ